MTDRLPTAASAPVTVLDMTTSAQARRWAKTDATQRRILDAATEVFATRGFTAATMADVVTASGASIGSIYHHFGGKSELFLAIFEQMADAIDRRIEVMQQAGPADPRRTFELHVRAYLEAMWGTGASPGCCRRETHRPASKWCVVIACKPRSAAGWPSSSWASRSADNC